MPRSGTTWLARMLSTTERVMHIYEPLNPRRPPGRSPGVLRAPFPRGAFHYICQDNEAQYLDAYRDLVRFRYHLLAELRANHSRSDLELVASELPRFLRARLRRRRALVADPYAVFSAEWFARRLDFRVVVSVRHPAAVVSSHKRLGWRERLQDLLDQPLLVRDRLSPMRAELEDMLSRDEDVVGRASLLWRAVYGWVAELGERVPGVLLVRHEDLSRNPLERFERLYHALGVPFTDEAATAIARSTGAGNPEELDAAAPHETQLDSRANLDNWRRRLEPEEVARVRELTSDVAARFYPEEEWHGA